MQLHLSKLRHSVLDGPRRIASPQAELTRTPNGFMVRASLSSLGNPTHVLGSVRTYAGKLPLDWVAWHIFEMPGAS